MHHARINFLCKKFLHALYEKPMQIPLHILLIFLFTPLSAIFEDPDELKTQQFYGIIHEYEEQIKKDPHNVKLIVAVADVYFSLREWAKAVHYYRRALELDPKSLKIKTALALAYLNNNQISDSLDLFKQVIQEDPNNVDALGGLGRIEALKHHFQKAEFFYQKALSHKRNHFETLFYIAELRIDEKRYAEAQEILTKLLARDPNAAWVKQALKRAELGPFLEKATSSACSP